jgi:murein DD-endopeptidase MepM/ murein hydrolase activator NlpD
VVCGQCETSPRLRLVIAGVAGVLAMQPAVGRSEPQAAATRAATAAVAQSPSLVAPPVHWLPARGRECATSGKSKGFCQGPRRVPAPHGPEAEVAARLHLGTTETAGDLLVGAPKPEWVKAAGAERGETLLFPVKEGMVWRGLQKAQHNKKHPHPSHKGVDIGAPDGTLIRAVKSGVVAYSDNGVRGYGNLLVTVHADGSVALYGHCQAIYVFPGQHVTQGQIIGEVGHTGIARGSHLHFEYRERGALRDPLIRFKGMPGT